MKLKEYRDKKGYTLAEMAIVLGVGKSMIFYWENGKRIPRPKNMMLIERHTEGKVKAKDFY